MEAVPANAIVPDPGFPASQREFVRVPASVGAQGIGAGDRPPERLDDELDGRLGGDRTIASPTDEGALERAAREVRRRMWVDRLEAVIGAHVRERCGIHAISAPTAHPCRDKVAMKDTLREAGVPTAASAGVADAIMGHEGAEEIRGRYGGLVAACATPTTTGSAPSCPRSASARAEPSGPTPRR